MPQSLTKSTLIRVMAWYWQQAISWANVNPDLLSLYGATGSPFYFKPSMDK